MKSMPGISTRLQKPKETQDKCLLKLRRNPCDPDGNVTSAAASKTQKCFFCENNMHHRRNCPARNASRQRCGKIGHYAKVCHSRTSATLHFPNSDNDSIIYRFVCYKSPIKLNGKKVWALMDTGSTESFICESLVQNLGLSTVPGNNTMSIASTSLGFQTSGYCLVNVKVDRQKYFEVKLAVPPDLCAAVILEQILWGNTKVSVGNLVERGPLKRMRTDYFLGSSITTIC